MATPTSKGISLGTRAILNAASPHDDAAQDRYADTLEDSDEYDEKHTALRRFLLSGTEGRYNYPPIRQTTMTIIDHMGDSLAVAENVIPLKGHVDSQFKRALDDLPKGSRGRFLLWQTGSLGSMNHHYLDFIALKYQLNPSFLSAHLSAGFRREPGGNSHFSHLKPSQRGYLQIHEDRESFLTIMYTQHLDRFLVIALGQHDYSPARLELLGRFVQKLEKSNLLIAQTLTRPMDIIVPYVEKLLKSATANIINYTFSQSIGNYDPRELVEQESSLRFNWGTLQTVSTNLQALKQNLYSYQQSAAPNQAISEKPLKIFMKDLDILIKEAAIQANYHQQIIQMAVSSVASQQSKQSLREALLTRRLGIIACIFLPMNFATSFLGMNVKQLNGGALGMGWFFSIAILAGVLSILTLMLNPSLEASWASARVSAAHDEGFYDEEEFDIVTTRQVVRRFAKDLWKHFRHWWLSNLQARLRRAKPKEHPV